jgi:hypothetical protein
MARGLAILLGGAGVALVVVTLSSMSSPVATEAAADGDGAENSESAGSADTAGAVEVDGIDIAQVIEDGEQARLDAQIDTSLAEASLAALRENGVLPEASAVSEFGARAAAQPVLGLVHIIRCWPESCDLIVEWGAANGFQTSEPVLTLGHGGAEEFHIELRQALAAEASAITVSAQQVAAAVESMADSESPDLFYDGWAPELIEVGLADE